MRLQLLPLEKIYLCYAIVPVLLFISHIVFKPSWRQPYELLWDRPRSTLQPWPLFIGLAATGFSGVAVGTSEFLNPYRFVRFSGNGALTIFVICVVADIVVKWKILRRSA